MTAALMALLVGAAVADLRLGRIPNWLTYPAILIGVAGNAGWGIGLTGSLLGFALGFGLLLFCWLAGGMGGGDAKLMGAIGAMTGWEVVLLAMVYGFVVAAAMAIFVMVRRRLVRRTLRRVWHTLVLVVIPGAKPADPTSQDSPTIPFAVAVCIGTFAAVVRVLWVQAHGSGGPG